MGWFHFYKKLKSDRWNMSAKLQVAPFHLGLNISQLPGTAVYSPAIWKRPIVLCQDSRKAPAEKCWQRSNHNNIDWKKKKTYCIDVSFRCWILCFHFENSTTRHLYFGKMICWTSTLINVNGLINQMFRQWAGSHFFLNFTFTQTTLYGIRETPKIILLSHFKVSPVWFVVLY